MDAYDEALTLMNNLPAKGPLSWEVGKIYNALLEVAKERQPDSVSLRMMEPLQKADGIPYVSAPGAGDIRAMLAIVVSALDPGPSV